VRLHLRQHGAHERPLWAKKAWGVYWTFDPRLTTLLLTVLIYAAVVMLRAFGGSGEAEARSRRRLTVLGTVDAADRALLGAKVGRQPPDRDHQGRRRPRSPDMKLALGIGFFAMTLLAALLCGCGRA
jgi:heme exporter protein C